MPIKQNTAMELDNYDRRILGILQQDGRISNNDLADRIEQALALNAQQREATAAVDSVRSRVARLTSREKQIMELVLAGKFNKVIADELNISMRTVEVHRANIFDKMQVKTAVELANLLKSGG